MNDFKTILTKLKAILSNKDQFPKKVLDKDIATELKINPTALASYKYRDKAPYQAILTYCHNNRLDVRKILFNEDASIIIYPTPRPVDHGKVQIRYFRTLEAYRLYLNIDTIL